MERSRQGPGRPRKYGRAARAVTVTLPEDVLARLAVVHADLGRAIVALTERNGKGHVRAVRPAEMIRINTDIKGNLCAPVPSRLGVLGGDACGFPNGRRLADDVTDVALRAVACGYGFDLGPCDSDAPYAATTERLGDGVDGNDVPFLSGFPYVGTPHQGYEHTHNHSGGSMANAQ